MSVLPFSGHLPFAAKIWQLYFKRRETWDLIQSEKLTDQNFVQGENGDDKCARNSMYL